MDLEDLIIAFATCLLIAGIIAPLARPKIPISKRFFELLRAAFLVSSMMIASTVMALKQDAGTIDEYLFAIIILAVGIAVSIGLVSFCSTDFWLEDRD